MILWYFGQVDPNIMTYQFDSGRIGLSNRTRFNNPEMDKLLHAADSAMVYADRMAAVTAVQKFLVDNRPNVPLFSHVNYVGYRKDIVAGLKFDKAGGLNFMDAYILKP
jgi:ABC-type transport system substrate-binding protein